MAGCIVVYIWPIHDEFVGHSSMQLSDGTYISFWPRDEASYKSPESPPMQGEDLEEDTSNEGGVGPKVYMIPTNSDCLSNIRSWWEGFKSSTYNIKSNNCSTAIFLGFRAAFPYLSCLDGKVSIWVPKAIGMVAEGIPQGQAYFSQQKIQEIVDAAKNEISKIVEGHKSGKKGPTKGPKKGRKKVSKKL